ncbi:MAG: family 1 glycosylhydrolase, partial [Saprospiraceae bacterium]
MFLSFPEHFFWGTSTAAAQVETAGEHPWRGLVAKDGYRFERTTDHELRRAEDAGLIARLGSIYRCGVDWS